MDRMTVAHKLFAMENPHKLAWSVRTGDPLYRMRKDLVNKRRTLKIEKERAIKTYKQFREGLADVDFQMPNIKFRKPSF